MGPTRAPRPRGTRGQQTDSLSEGRGARTRAHLKRSEHSEPKMGPTRAPRPHRALLIRYDQHHTNDGYNTQQQRDNKSGRGSGGPGAGPTRPVEERRHRGARRGATRHSKKPKPEAHSRAQRAQTQTGGTLASVASAPVSSKLFVCFVVLNTSHAHTHARSRRFLACNVSIDGT